MFENVVTEDYRSNFLKTISKLNCNSMLYFLCFYWITSHFRRI